MTKIHIGQEIKQEVQKQNLTIEDFAKNLHLASSEIENIFLIGSFGASSVLIYGAVNSPLAQPRNLIGGHVLSALVGVTAYKFVPDILW